VQTGNYTLERIEKYEHFTNKLRTS